MKKKIIIAVVAAVLIMTISAPSVFAKSFGNDNNNSAISSMFDSMRNWLQQAKDKGEVTGEEAKQWEEHFDVMEKYHEENGFGGCGGYSSDGTVENGYRMPGNGRGMMGF